MRLRRLQRGFILDPYRFAASVDTNVLALLHLDGANGSTTITDSSTYSRTFTAGGGATISTAQSKFGGASLSSLTGLNSGANCNYSGSMLRSTGPFTHELWVRRNVTSGSGYFVSAGSGNNVFLWVYQYGANIYADFGFNNSTWGLQLVTSGFTFAANTWYFLQVRRSGDTFTVHIDGTQRASGTWSGDIERGNPAGGTLVLGNSGGLLSTSAAGMNGYIDDYRYSRIAQSTAVPTAAFPNP